MTDPRLPQARFTELPAPPDGEAVAVRAGRGIRRRRRMVGTGAAALSMALIAGVAVAAGTGSNHAGDQLLPPAVPGVHEASTAPSPGATLPGTVAAARPPATGGGPAVGKAPAAGTAPGTTGLAAAPPPPSGTGGGSHPSYVTPGLRRTYAEPIPAGARVCSAQVSGTDTATHKRIDWCLSAVAARTEAGHDLSITVCRDQTTDARLSFATNHEVELTVSHSGHVVWRWSAGHPGTRQPHALTTPAGACWTWTAPWTDVDASGRPLGSGSYKLTVTSLADEVADLPDDTSTFNVD